MSASNNFKSDDELETSFPPRILFSPDTLPLAPLPPASPLPRRFRGKVIILEQEQSLDGPTLTTLEYVINNARDSNFSKKLTLHLLFIHSMHDHHTSSFAKRKRRGLTSDLIGLVAEAFEMKNTVARSIHEFIGQKRDRIKGPIAHSIFLTDPVKTMLNHVIRKIKKQKGYVLSIGAYCMG